MFPCVVGGDGEALPRYTNSLHSVCVLSIPDEGEEGGKKKEGGGEDSGDRKAVNTI